VNEDQVLILRLSATAPMFHFTMPIALTAEPCAKNCRRQGVIELDRIIHPNYTYQCGVGVTMAPRSVKSPRFSYWSMTSLKSSTVVVLTLCLWQASGCAVRAGGQKDSIRPSSTTELVRIEVRYDKNGTNTTYTLTAKAGQRAMSGYTHFVEYTSTTTDSTGSTKQTQRVGIGDCFEVYELTLVPGNRVKMGFLFSNTKLKQWATLENGEKAPVIESSDVMLHYDTSLGEFQRVELPLGGVAGVHKIHIRVTREPNPSTR
jgi:hypothetical protein